MGTVFDKNIRELINRFLLDSTEVESYLDLVGIIQSGLCLFVNSGLKVSPWGPGDTIPQTTAVVKNIVYICSNTEVIIASEIIINMHKNPEYCQEMQILNTAGTGVHFPTWRRGRN